MKKGLSVFALLGAAVLLVALTVVPAGQVSAQNPLTTTLNISAADQSAALAFWTHSRIASAKPFPMPVAKGAPIFASSGANQSAAFGTQGSSPAGFAAAGVDATLQKAYASDWAMGQSASANAPADQEAGTGQVFTSYNANLWAPAQTIYPNKWAGRLSFSTAGGSAYCSATAVYGNNFVTAAHCVYDTTNNVWYSNWAFTPAYRNGSAPYGTFAATYCTVLTAWVNLTGGYNIAGWTPYDVAVCSVGQNSAHVTLNSAVGWAGYEYGYNYVQHVFTQGYPWENTNSVAIPAAGAYLRTCSAETWYAASGVDGMGCNWGPGISGSSWMVGYAPNVAQGWVNSVVSGYYSGTPNLYGIYFSSANYPVICGVRGCL